MGKGAIDDRSHLSLMAVGLQARDHVLSGFDRADLVICVGYDLVEYAPSSWDPDGGKRVIHIDTQPAEIDAAYRPEVELIGDIDGTLRRLLERGRADGRRRPRSASERHESREILVHADLRMQLLEELAAHASNDGWPITPQRAIVDLRRALGPSDIVVSDVGAHKVWVARMYQAYEPNTVIISNGFAAMGIAIPGAIAAKLVHPDRKVVALCGDGGFLMNSQELETAKRVGAAICVIVWRDDGYGLIDWKQRNEFGRPFGVEFGNPDFVAYAESFGIAGFRPSSAADLYPTLMRALEVDGPSLVEVPIDYAENLRLTERLGALGRRGVAAVHGDARPGACFLDCQIEAEALPASCLDAWTGLPNTFRRRGWLQQSFGLPLQSEKHAGQRCQDAPGPRWRDPAMWGRMDPWPERIDASGRSSGWSSRSSSRSVGQPRRRPPMPRSPPGVAASTCTRRACSRRRSRGCGARPPAPRSCATSSTTARITAARTRACTSNGCATEPLQPAALGRGRPAGLDGRPATVRRRPLSARRRDSFMGALRLAVTRMRKTEPARGPDGVARQPRLGAPRLHRDRGSREDLELHVTSVRVSGPLWGLQNSSFGYDMRPNTKLTVTQLKRFFTKWWYAPKRMIWDNKYVSIQPIPASTTSTTASTAPAAAPVEPVSPAPSAATSVPIPSTAAAPAVAPRQDAEPSTATAQPTGSPPTLPIADLVLVLVSGGLAVVLVTLVSRIGRSGTTSRGFKRPRTGWSS